MIAGRPFIRFLRMIALAAVAVLSVALAVIVMMLAISFTFPPPALSIRSLSALQYALLVGFARAGAAFLIAVAATVILAAIEAALFKRGAA